MTHLKHLFLSLALLALIGAGCTSVGNLGLVTRSGSDPAAVLRTGHRFREMGFVEGCACRSFLLNVVPWGNGDIQAAVDDALNKSGGDALLNVTTSNTLLGFVPLYNIFSSDCTRVRGTAIKFETAAR